MSGATHVTVRVRLKIRRATGRRTVVTPLQDCVDAAISTRADPALVKALARAFRYQKLLDEGRYASISEMAAAERIERGYLGSLLRLTLLRRTLSRPSWMGGSRTASRCPNSWSRSPSPGQGSGQYSRKHLKLKRQQHDAQAHHLHRR